jgi:hypothetical protein
MALGPRDTLSLVSLTGWDAAALRNFALQDGTTFDMVVGQMNAALGALNAELFNHPIWSSLVSYTDQPDLEYRVGASNGMERFTEYGRPDAKRAETEGHMLPLIPFDRGLGWTWDYLRKARMSQVQADIADGIKDVRDTYRKAVLTRLLKRGDDSGALNGLGTSGLAPGFATAAASTGVDFAPPAWGGNTFTSDHEHYVGIAGGAFTNAVFSDVKQELREHGHEPPYNVLIGPSDETAVKALTQTIEVASSVVQYGMAQDLARIAGDSPTPGAYPIGVNNDCVIWVVAGIPQYYGVGYKTYGPNSQRNPLRVRLQKGQTAPQVIAMTDPRSGAGGAYPLQYMMLFFEFGVGVADRTAATPRYTNNTTWADGTPT